MPTILVTGFEPFGGDTINPALEAVKQLNGKAFTQGQVITRPLPVTKGIAIETLQSYIREFDPVVIIAVGQAGGRSDLSIERVAINVDDFRIADNGGHQPVDEPIVPGGPAAYWSTLPVKAITKQLLQSGIPASVSNTAGTFVCNHVFYGLMHHLAQEGNVRRGGFIHIPYLPEQVCTKPGQPSMALSTIISGLELIIETAVATSADISYSAGTIC